MRIQMPLHRTGVAAMAILTVFLLCGAQQSPQGCDTSNARHDDFGTGKGAIIGAAVGVVAVITVGTVVLVEVHKSHHRVKGCVSSGPNGLQVTTDDTKPKTYLLEGDTARVKTGDLVQFHGDKVKRTKDAGGEQTFRVEKISKDYGACKVAPAA